VIQFGGGFEVEAGVVELELGLSGVGGILGSGLGVKGSRDRQHSFLLIS